MLFKRIMKKDDDCIFRNYKDKLTNAPRLSDVIQKTKKYECYMVFIVLVCLFTIFCANAADNLFPVRIAYIGVADMDGYTIPDAFLDRAARNGFNYILAEFPIVGSDWNRNTGAVLTSKTTGKTLKQKLTEAFVKVNAKKMRLIPLFQTGDCHCGDPTTWGWGLANAKISWNIVTYTSPTDGKPATAYCPAYAKDPTSVNGMDYSFKQLITTIRNAFKDANLPYPLEYIHIGQDEPIIYFWSSSSPYNEILVGQCNLDRNYLNLYDANKDKKLNQAELQKGMQTLFVDQIKRRVDNTYSICNASGYGYGTKTIIYSDMLDPEHLGGHPCFTPVDPSVYITTTGMLSLFLTDTKNKLIANPWCYDIAWGFVLLPNGSYDWIDDYDTYNTFNTFKSKGIKFIFAHEIGDDCFWNDGVGGKDNRRMKQLSEEIFYATMPQFRSSCIGYASVHWCPWNDVNTSISYLTMEYFATLCRYYDANY